MTTIEVPCGSAQDDIVIGKPSSDPPHVLSPIVDHSGGPLQGAILSSTGGPPMFGQFFEFDPKTKQVAKAHLPRTMETVLANTVIDSAHLYGTKKTKDSDSLDCSFIFGELLTKSRHLDPTSPNAQIVLNFLHHSKIYISPNYVVSPAETGQPQVVPTSYFVTIAFVGGNQETVKFYRNGAPFVPGVVSNVRRESDLIEWNVGRGGKVVRKGSFGFPVVGTVPDLVLYIVNTST